VGFPTVLIGKVLSARVVIVAGSSWDTPAGRADIQRQIEAAEANLGVRIITGPYETSADPTLTSIPEGPWSGANHYSPQQVAAINTYGAAGRPALIYGNAMPASAGIGPNNALTVGHPWEGSSDGLTNEGVLFTPSHVGSTTSHELGHLLSGQTGANNHSTDPNNLMYGSPNRTGTNFTNPWSDAAEANPVLQ
jgi:hypothetical protein